MTLIHGVDPQSCPWMLMQDVDRSRLCIRVLMLDPGNLLGTVAVFRVILVLKPFLSSSFGRSNS